jgi:translocator protein
MPNFLKCIFSIIICLLVGFTASYFTIPSIKTWYAILQKPSFTPPNYLFAPVWTMLYVLMGISFFLIWKTNHTKKNRVMAIFVFQLILNFFWSIIFFHWKEIQIALVEIFVLLAAIINYAIYSYKINKIAVMLFIPYILWVGFATALNIAIVLLN